MLNGCIQFVTMLLAWAVLVQPQPDFTGIWQVDLKRSTIHGRPVSQILIKIEQQEPKIVQQVLITYATGEQAAHTFIYETTGRETSNSVGGATVRTRAHWEATELVIESWMKRADRELHFKDHWSLSRDGRVLTMAHLDDDLAGQVSVLEKAPLQAAALFDKPKHEH